MLNLAIVHNHEKSERRVKRHGKTPEQKVHEKRFHLDERFHVHRVTGNKGRSREKQELKRQVEEQDYE